MGRKSHIFLLITALLVLQFPQFISGTTAIIIFASIFAISVLAWPRMKIIYGPLAVFVLLMALSIMWSEHPRSAFNASYSAFVIVAAGLGVGAALPLPLILKVLHRSTVVISGISLALGVALPSVGLHSGPAYSGTLIGLYISKNSLAAVVMFGFLAMLFRERESKCRALPVMGSLAVYIPVLVWTESATVLAIVAIGIAVRVVYGWWVKASEGMRVAGFALVLVPVILLSMFALSIYNGVLGLLDRDVSLTGRTDIWQAALDAWQTHPWFGVGWGSFKLDSTVSYFQLLRYGWVRDHAHSGYIQVLTELGIAGAVVLGITLLIVLATVVRAARRLPILANGWLLTAFIAFVAHNYAEQSMRLLPLFILALIYGACGRQRMASNTSTTAAIRAQNIRKTTRTTPSALTTNSKRHPVR